MAQTLIPKAAAPSRPLPALTQDSDSVVVIPKYVRDLAGFRQWIDTDEFPERHKITFLAGEVIVDMSQEEYTTHALLKAAIVKALMIINDDEDRGMVIGDGGRLTNLEADLSAEPDTMFVSYSAIETKRATFTPRRSDPDQTVEMVGTPDLVVEIVSNSSVKKDYHQLRDSYRAASIPEYWLIDARGEEMLFQILSHAESGYAVTPDRDGWIRSEVFAREFRLVRSKNRVGMWKYLLESRAK